MKALVFSPLAEADLRNIWRYSAATWGADQADRYTDDIRDACHALASQAKRGAAVDLRPDYLKYFTGVHVIYFKDTASQLEVIRVLHQKQDASRRL